jgi:hypothetical protein
VSGNDFLVIGYPPCGRESGRIQGSPDLSSVRRLFLATSLFFFLFLFLFAHSLMGESRSSRVHENARVAKQETKSANKSIREEGEGRTHQGQSERCVGWDGNKFESSAPRATRPGLSMADLRRHTKLELSVP